MSTKKKDDELPVLSIVIALFTLTFFAVCIFYSDFKGMTDSVWGITAFGVIGLADVLVTFKMFKEWQNPNYDYYRKIGLALTIAGILLVAGFKVADKDRIKSSGEIINVGDSKIEKK